MRLFLPIAFAVLGTLAHAATYQTSIYKNNTTAATIAVNEKQVAVSAFKTNATSLRNTGLAFSAASDAVKLSVWKNFAGPTLAIGDNFVPTTANKVDRTGQMRALKSTCTTSGGGCTANFTWDSANVGVATTDRRYQTGMCIGAGCTCNITSSILTTAPSVMVAGSGKACAVAFAHDETIGTFIIYESTVNYTCTQTGMATYSCT